MHPRREWLAALALVASIGRQVAAPQSFWSTDFDGTGSGSGFNVNWGGGGGGGGGLHYGAPDRAPPPNPVTSVKIITPPSSSSRSYSSPSYSSYTPSYSDQLAVTAMSSMFQGLFSSMFSGPSPAQIRARQERLERERQARIEAERRRREEEERQKRAYADQKARIQAEVDRTLDSMEKLPFAVRERTGLFGSKELVPDFLGGGGGGGGGEEDRRDDTSVVDFSDMTEEELDAGWLRAQERMFAERARMERSLGDAYELGDTPAIGAHRPASYRVDSEAQDSTLLPEPLVEAGAEIAGEAAIAGLAHWANDLRIQNAMRAKGLAVELNELRSLESLQRLGKLGDAAKLKRMKELQDLAKTAAGLSPITVVTTLGEFGIKVLDHAGKRLDESGDRLTRALGDRPKIEARIDALRDQLRRDDLDAPTRDRLEKEKQALTHTLVEGDRLLATAAQTDPEAQAFMAMVDPRTLRDATVEMLPSLPLGDMAKGLQRKVLSSDLARPFLKGPAGAIQGKVEVVAKKLDELRKKEWVAKGEELAGEAVEAGREVREAIVGGGGKTGASRIGRAGYEAATTAAGKAKDKAVEAVRDKFEKAHPGAKTVRESLSPQAVTKGVIRSATEPLVEGAEAIASDLDFQPGSP